jgi:hypothetical protein
MTKSGMQDTPAGCLAVGADGPRWAQPEQRAFAVAYKVAIVDFRQTYCSAYAFGSVSS